MRMFELFMSVSVIISFIIGMVAAISNYDPRVVALFFSAPAGWGVGVVVADFMAYLRRNQKN